MKERVAFRQSWLKLFMHISADAVESLFIATEEVGDEAQYQTEGYIFSVVASREVAVAEFDPWVTTRRVAFVVSKHHIFFDELVFRELMIGVNDPVLPHKSHELQVVFVSVERLDV
jgi:hypothetical protein